jgi:hypothetical protein
MTELHRIYFCVHGLPTWYAIMGEARTQFGKSWRAQPRVKRKLERHTWTPQEHWVWFEVPDPVFASWIAVKLGVGSKIKAGK